MSAITRFTGSAIFVLLVVLLVESLFETWLLVLLGDRVIGPSGAPELTIPAWPRTIRNGLYIGLAILTAIHIAGTGRLRRFTAPADLAFAVLVLALLLAGVAGGSSLRLTAEGVFVYLRAVVLLYAIRALAPTWSSSRSVLWLLGAIVALNAVVAIVLAWIGPSGYQALGFVDMTWANLHRAQAFQSHPNHLGHVTGLAILGLLAWFASTATVRARWWALFVLLAVALALSQSRESLLGVLSGIVVAAILVSGHRARLLAALASIVVITGISWTAQPGNWTELARRLNGVVAAVEIPSGEENGVSCDPSAQDCGVDGIPKRENRVLFYQQGFELWLRSPLLGYGVGQFGGAVASQNDPEWYRNPKFGPDGFDMHGLDAQQVDSFWLHLTVETGLIGTLAYLAWFAFLWWPSVMVAVRRMGHRADEGASPVRGSPSDIAVGADDAGDPVGVPSSVALSTNVWAAAALVFGGISAVFSPALEDPLFAPLLMAIVGLAWVMRSAPVPERASSHLAPAVAGTTA